MLCSAFQRQQLRRDRTERFRRTGRMNVVMAKQTIANAKVLLWGWLSIACAFFPISEGGADELLAFREAATLNCSGIPPNKYETALIFNPSGMQTLYPRSVCFQEIAVKLRDESLCNEVKESKSLIFDGSAISAGKCRLLVQEQVSRDRTLAGQIKGIFRVAKVNFERNGNGKDFDAKVIATGSYPHSYNVVIALLIEPNSSERVVYQNDHFFGPSAEGLSLYIPQRVILGALDGRPLEIPYRVRTRITLVPSMEEVKAFSFIPNIDKESVYETLVDFGRLRRAEPLNRQ